MAAVSVDIKVSVIAFILAAFAVSALMTPVSMRLAAKLRLIDAPEDARRMHKKPMPCFGGLAIFVSVMVVTMACEALVGHVWSIGTPEATSKLNAALVGGAAMFVVGVIDDRFDMRARTKLIGQVACAIFVFALGVRIPAFSVLGWRFGDGGVVSLVITVVWIIAITNMVNLIDGLDGLAGGVAGIAALAIGYSAYINELYMVTFFMMVLAGAALGFLPFNFYPAKTFMGDGGSMFLGFMLATISIVGPAKSATIMAVIAPIVVLGVPSFDVVFAMIRRMLNRRPLFDADKGHLHHQLARIGMGQRRAAIMLYCISGIMGIAAIVFSRELYLEAAGLLLIAVVFIVVLIWDWNKKERK